MSIYVSWQEFDELLLKLSEQIRSEGVPDLIVGLQRGGLIPGVILSHKLGVRDFEAIDIRRTMTEEIDAEKMSPRLGSSVQTERLADRDILLVDDVAGTGVTLWTIKQLVSHCSPRRMRSLVCFLNQEKWDSADTHETSRLISYIGKEVRGWIIFPWENRQ